MPSLMFRVLFGDDLIEIELRNVAIVVSTRIVTILTVVISSQKTSFLDRFPVTMLPIHSTFCISVVSRVYINV
jgi:hypothetical protein